jgi:hypothetical protein
LPEEYVNYIVLNFDKIKIEYPQKPDYRNKWESVGWKESPITEDEKIFYDFIVGNEECYFFIMILFKELSNILLIQLI